ncbi:MAG: PAS domain S-box protein [Pyrinomonadaceae bacterium]|nr:PAS domain S-box protein [Pyrinomonadaceae bacterium]
MFSLDEKYLSANTQINQRIQTLIIGRLLVIFVLLVASWVWNSGQFVLSIEKYPRGLLLVFLLSVGLTIVYFFILRLSKNYLWQVQAQFLLDALLITWLVWRTGDLSSPYIPLYIVTIAASSFFLSSRGTLLIASLCTLLFTISSVSAVSSLIESYGAKPESSRVVQILTFHIVAFLVVGLLASRLSKSHASGEELKETTKTLANLRVLHERIVESIRSGLITTDLEGNIYTFNQTAAEITGHQPDEMRGKSIYSLFGNIKLPIADSLGATATGDQPPRFETDVVTPDNFVVRVGYGISPLFAETGETTGLILTFQDLTEIRSMEENVRRKDRLAAVGRVAAGLAHEIRNPLGAMRGAIQVLQLNTPPESSNAKLMDIVLRESDRLNNIITNFLSYARPRVSNFSEVDVRQAVSDTFTLLKHSPDVKENHILEADLPAEPVMISADQTQIKQIFWNLARNAVGAMADGGKLLVKLEKLNERRVKIVFTDTGIGMSAGQVERLFEPFSASTTGGTGLGLSIVYQIVRDHNGTINVRSREDEGTTITVELPTESKNIAALDDLDSSEMPHQPSRLGNLLNVRK